MPTSQQVYLSVVIPIYNEEETIPELYNQLRPVLSGLERPCEIIFVDDGSRDGSLGLLQDLHRRDPSVKVLSFSRNFGHQVAVTAGIDHTSGEAVVVMDADLQDPPEVIPRLVARWEEGHDVVYAVRESREGERRFKLATAKVFYRLLNRLSNIDVPYDAGDFRLISRRAADSLSSLRERNRYIRGLTSWVGYTQTGVTYDRASRHAGETKYSLRRMLRLALDGMTSFSFVPLQFATFLGFFIAVVCIVYSLYVIYAAVFGDATVRGWASTMVAILFLGSIQLITIGIIGEYLGRVYDEVKQRPLYIVRESLGFEQQPAGAQPLHPYERLQHP